MTPETLLLAGVLVVRAFTRVYAIHRGAIPRQAQMSARPPICGDQAPRLFLLLPALDEQPLVDATLTHFSGLTNQIAWHTSILVITTPEDVELSTRAAIEAWQARNPLPQVELREDRVSRTKQSKLAVAIKQLKDDGALREHDWVGIFDFDVRLPEETLVEFTQLATRCPNVSAIQQVPTTMPTRSSSLFGRLNALAHLERVLAIETTLHQSMGNPSRILLRACMGASLFIRADALSCIGGIPPDSDDITLGYRLDLARLDRAYLTLRAAVQTVNRPADYLRQHARIYAAVVSVGGAYDAVFPGAGTMRRLLSTLAICLVDFHKTIVASILFILVFLLRPRDTTFLVSLYSIAEMAVATSLVLASRTILAGRVSLGHHLVFVLLSPVFLVAREAVALFHGLFWRRRGVPVFSSPREADSAGLLR